MSAIGRMIRLEELNAQIQQVEFNLFKLQASGTAEELHTLNQQLSKLQNDRAIFKAQYPHRSDSIDR